MCVVVIYTVAGTKVGSPSSCVSKEFFEADNAFAEEVETDIERISDSVYELNFSQIGLMCGHFILAIVNFVLTVVRRRTPEPSVPTDGQRPRGKSVFLA